MRRVIFSLLQSVILAPALFGRPTQGRQAAADAVIPDASQAIRHAIDAQVSYLAKQRQYVCRYHRVSRTRYESGLSIMHSDQEDEFFFPSHGNDNAGAPQTDSKMRLISVDQDTFAVWNTPLFQIILAHSLFSAGERHPIGPGRSMLEYTYRPNDAFRPKTDLERIAQALAGRILIDEQQHVFRYILGDATQSVFKGKQMLLLGPGAEWNGQPIPLFQYAATPYGRAIIPAWWNEASFRPVRRGPNEVSDWDETLTRTFLTRESCREYQVRSTLLPGFTARDENTPPPE
jgi:hypothetical protein